MVCYCVSVLGKAVWHGHTLCLYVCMYPSVSLGSMYILTACVNVPLVLVYCIIDVPSIVTQPQTDEVTAASWFSQRCPLSVHIRTGIGSFNVL